jgi:hypothetical protein
MPTIVLTVDESALESQSDIPQLQNATPDEHPSPADVRTMLETVDAEAIEVQTPVHHPEWETGEPCPECGNDTLSVMVADEDHYRSRNGEFSYLQNATAVGVKTSVLCPNCTTPLFDTPVEQLGI